MATNESNELLQLFLLPLWASCCAAGGQQRQQGLARSGSSSVVASSQQPAEQQQQQQQGGGGEGARRLFWPAAGAQLHWLLMSWRSVGSTAEVSSQAPPSSSRARGPRASTLGSWGCWLLLAAAAPLPPAHLIAPLGALSPEEGSCASKEGSQRERHLQSESAPLRPALSEPFFFFFPLFRFNPKDPPKPRQRSKDPKDPKTAERAEK